MGKISKPEPINLRHQLDQFNSEEPTLNDWLMHRALDNEHNGASRTFVVHVRERVVGYYCLAAGSVLPEIVPSKLRRNMPKTIPVMVLGRLAVDRDWQNGGIGSGLLKDAVLRTARLSLQAGIKALLVHTLSDTAKYFYKRYGFVESPIESMTLMLPLSKVSKS